MDLLGRGILVTRPAAQAERLCQLISDAGGNPIRFPTLEIRPIEDSRLAREQLSSAWYLIFFVSANAVALANQIVPAKAWQTQRIATIGAATARQLAHLGRPADLLPEGTFESETLLAMPELQNVAGKRILIVRGQGGRTVFGDILIKRGADVKYAEVYRRVCPAVDPVPLISHWRQKVSQVTVTSTEVLENLMAIMGEEGRKLLLHTPLVVISNRTLVRAEQQGFRYVELADNATDAAIIAALLRQPVK